MNAQLRYARLIAIVFFTLATFLILVVPALAQGPIYVTPTGAGNGDGSSWGNAATLQDALTTYATSGDEIWVATGIYTPGIDVSDSFVIPSGVALYGGFAATETLRTERNWFANPTILSGDLGGDDITDNGVVTDTNNIVDDNAYHVIYLDGSSVPITTTTRIDGFVVTAGFSDDYGGGIYAFAQYTGECSPVIANTTLSGNRARGYGGGMYNMSEDVVASPSLENVIFSGNTADEFGGGLHNEGRYGGTNNLSLVNVTFSRNNSDFGGGFYNFADGGEIDTSLVNVTFSDNQATSDGGGLYDKFADGVTNLSLDQVTFSGNAASRYGGGLYNAGTSPSLTNVTFTGNTAGSKGGAVYNEGWINESSPSLVNVVFDGNSATSKGGAVYNEGEGGTSSPSLVNITFNGNTAGSQGGAMYSNGASGGDSSPSLANVILWENSAGTGAQLYNNQATPTISNTLVSSTTADIFNNSSTITWGPGNITDTSALTTTDIFVDATNDDLHLATGSPAIDSGDNNALPVGVITDRDGNPRIVDDTVDLGAYEYSVQLPQVTIAKSVDPASDVPYQTSITYTLVLSNTGADDPSVLLTDTLPSAVDFAAWIDQAGAAVENDVITWSGALNNGAFITLTFQVTNTAIGVTVTNTVEFSATAQAGSAQVTYAASSTVAPNGSGSWSEVFPPCTGVCNYVIPAGMTVTLEDNLELTGNLTIEPGATFDPNGKTVTLTGDQAQTLTGNPLTFYNLLINKTNKTDTVTIVGKLKSTKRMRIARGTLYSASDYEDIEIDTDGVMVLTSDITVGGNVAITGTLTTDGWGITFDGGVEQNLGLNVLTFFDAITVTSGTTLIEVNSSDNAFLQGALTNYGTIRKTQSIPGVEFYYFGLAGVYPDSSSWGMELEVTDLTGDDPLTAIQVDRIDKPHPNAPSGGRENIYWTITGTGADFVANVTLPHDDFSTPSACRYSGGEWECANDGSDTEVVTFGGATAFSDWAVLNDSFFAKTYYVNAATGDDSRSASEAQNPATPWQTISHAAATVPAGADIANSNVISVAAGTYDAVLGEIFPIEFYRDNVSLITSGAAGTIVDGYGDDEIIQVFATGIRIEGLTLQNGNLYAIVLKEGGAIVAGNVFSTTGRGIELGMQETLDGTPRTVDPITITQNTFSNATPGVRFSLNFDGDYTDTTLDIGAISILSNTFSAAGADGIRVNNFDVYDLAGGAVTVGDITVTGNTFSGGATGFDCDYEGNFTDLSNSTLSIGDLTIADNSFIDQIDYGVNLERCFQIETMADTVVTAGDVTAISNTVTNQGLDGLRVYVYYAGDWSGASSGDFGDLIVKDNVVASPASGGDGIYAYNIFPEDISGTTVFTSGETLIENNQVSSGEDGIQSGTDAGNLNGDPRITIGRTTIQSNTVSSAGYDGIYLTHDAGWDMNDTSRMAVGDFVVAGNQVVTAGESGIQMWVDYQGEYSDGASQLTLNPITITNNSVTGSEEGIYVGYYTVGYDMGDSAQVEVGPLTIASNTITGTVQDGIYVGYEYVAYTMYLDTRLEMGPVTIEDNLITSAGNDAIEIYYDEEYVGVDMYDYADAKLPDTTIANNTIRPASGYDGIALDNEYNGYGIYENASVDFGDFTADNNVIIGDDGENGIDYYTYFFCYECSGNSSSSIGDITITGNQIEGFVDEAIVVYHEEMAWDWDYEETTLIDEAAITLGNTLISNNIITGTGSGVSVDFEVSSTDDAAVDVGTTEISGNTLSDLTEDGVWLAYDFYNEASSTAELGSVSIQQNIISSCSDDGIFATIEFDDTGDADYGAMEIVTNTVSSCAHGTHIDWMDPRARVSNNRWLDSTNTGLFVYNYGSPIDVISNTISATSPAADARGIYLDIGTINLADTNPEDYATGIHQYRGTINTTTALTVAGDIRQEGGTFQAQNNTLDIGDDLILAGGKFYAPSALSLTNFFTHTGGTYYQTLDVNGSSNVGFPKAGGLILNANGSDLGSTAVAITAGAQCSGATNSVAHCYIITPATATGRNATGTFYYNASEIPAGQSCPTAEVYDWSGATWTGWQVTDSRQCSTSPYAVTASGIDGFSPFAIRSAPDLSIAKSVTPGAVEPGDTITYTLVFSNANGPATGVVITDIIPVTIAVQSVISSGVSITDTGVSPAYVWTVGDYPRDAATGYITVTGVLSYPITTGTFTNTATIASFESDFDAGTNRASAAVSHCGNFVTVTNTADAGDGSLRWAVANTCPGGVVDFSLIYPATITLTSGEIPITKTLTIDGPGAANVIVSGNNAGRIFNITDTVTIDGLTLRDGYIAGDGGAIMTTAPLTLTASALVSNTATTSGGAIWANANAIVHDSLFQANAAASSGALAVDGSAFITNTSFVSNTTTGSTGAVSLGWAFELHNSAFISNTAGGSTGALDISLGNSDDYGIINNTRFENNRAATWNGAININNSYDTSVVSIIDSSFISNAAGTGAGAIWGNYAINLRLVDSLFQGNTAPKYGGLVIDQGLLSITGTQFIENRATAGSFGALYVTGDTVITNSNFISNSATANYGAIGAEGWSEDYPGGLAITGSEFRNNSAGGTAGAVYADLDITHVTLDDCLFQNNQAGTYAGALDAGGTLTISGTEFAGNVSYGADNSDGVDIGAGTIYARRDVTLVNSLLQENHAITASVGALYAMNAAVTITDTDFISNTAGGSYGAVFVRDNDDDPPQLSISGGAFRGNRADADAGALAADGFAVIDSVRFQENRAGGSGGAVLSTGSLTLTNSSFDSNRVEPAITPDGVGALDAGDKTGGAVALVGTGDARLLVQSSTFLSNTINANGAIAYGGALYATGIASGLVENVVVSENSAGFTSGPSPEGSGGGGLLFAEVGTLRVVSGTFSANSATYGGGILSLGNVSIEESVFQENEAFFGGALALYGDNAISETLVYNNFAAFGAISQDTVFQTAVPWPFPELPTPGRLAMVDSTIYSNTAQIGAISAIHGADLAIANTTIANNAGMQSASALFTADVSTTVTLQHVTIAGNYGYEAAENVAAIANIDIFGGGLASYTISNTLIAGGDGGPACAASLAAGPASAGNLDTDGTCGASFTQIDDAVLGEAGSYGGRTTGAGQALLTLPLLPGSPAIDAGNTTACLPVDQRGVTRPAGSACDVGAFESRGFAMTLAGGTGQSTSIGYTFATPLAVTVSSSYTEPVDGGRVIFSAPASGASALPTVYTGTVSSGAVTQTMTANMTIGGPYTVTAAARGATPAINFSLTNQCANPATVTNTDDSGLGSLRWAVAAACDYGTVNFNLAYPATIVLTSTQIVVDKNLTIDGPGASDVTVSGGNAMRVFKTASGKAVIIDGLTLRDGYTKESDGGGAIYATGPLTITSSILISNTADNTGSNDGRGGAISFYGGDYYGLVVQDTSILSNTAYQSGGGIIVRYGTLDLLRTTLAGNTAAGYAEQGGAIYLDEGSGTVITSVLRDNSVLPTGRGGALYVNRFDTLTISNTQIISNSAEKGGGLYIFESADLAINGGRIGGNTATANGGGLYFHNDDDSCGVTLAMSGVRVDLNQAANGGALYSSDAEENYACGTIEESIFVANQATDTGGALYFADDEIDIESSTFNGNTAEFEAGAIYVGYGGTFSDLTLFDNHSSGEGGAIFNAGDLEISGATIYSNTAGLIDSAIDAQKVGGSGGAIANVDDLVIYDSAIYSNTAGSNGGAIYNTLEAGRLAIYGSTFYANRTGCDGGAVSSASPMLVLGSEFHDNEASLECKGQSVGGAIHSEGELGILLSALHNNHAYAGGAIGIQGSLSVSTTTMIIGSAIYSNSADMAGAIGIGGPSYTRIEAASIYSNTALGVGGIGSAYGGATLELANTTLTGNSAATLASSLFVAGGNALENTAGFGPDSLILHNVTIAGNDRSGLNSHEADNFSAFVNADIDGSAATLAITNTIIAGGANERSCYTGAMTPSLVPPTTVNNLDNDGTCGSSFRQSDTILLGLPLSYSFDVNRVSIEVNTSILTPTLLVLPLLPGSAAIDSGATSMVATPAPDPGECPEADQRGIIRPVGSACDIGAFESQGFTLTKTGGDNQSTVWGTAFAQPLALSVSSSYSEPIDGGIVTFAGPASGASTAPVTQTATIAGGAASVTVSANDAGGAYSVTVSAAGAESVAFSLTNAQYATTTSVQSSRNPSPHGVPVTLTATVAISGVQALGDIGGPTGQVRFSDEAGELATVTLDGGTASLVKSDWAVGTHTVTVEYLGDVNYAGSTAQPFTQVTAPPMTAKNDAAGTLQGDAVVIDPLANDIDPAGGGLIVASVEQPAHGAVVIDAGAKTVTYTPDPAFTGADTFTYVARDVNGTTDDALVAVVVTALDETGNAPQISVVDNSTGSTATFDSGPFQVEVQVPAGIYTGTLGDKDVFYLAYTKVVTPTGDVTQPPGDFSFAGMVFDLSAYVNGIELGSYDFPSPLAIVITYDPALLGNLSPYLLTPFYWNGAAWVHDGMSITYIDPANHEISILVWHLTEFGLFAKPPLNTPNYIYLPTVARDSDLQSAAMPAPAAGPTIQEPAAVDEIPLPTPEPAPVEETPTEQPPATEAVPPAEEPAGEPVESTPEALPTEQAPVEEGTPPATEIELPAGEPVESTPEALPTEQAPVDEGAPPAEEPAGEPVESTPEALPTEQAPVDEAVPPSEEPAGEPVDNTPGALPTEQTPVQQTSAEEPAAPTPTPEAEQPVQSDAAPASGSTETAEPAPDESSVELPLQLHLPLIAR